MIDAHNHFTNINSILCTSELLPQNTNINTNKNIDLSKVLTSEIGLDKRFINLLTMEKQVENLRQCFSFAKQNIIPITIHSVHTTGIMLDLLKEYRFEMNTVIWHGFNESYETAKELSKLGILISIGPRYNKDIKSLIKIVPTLLLETDYEGKSVEEHDKIIENQYIMLSNITGNTIEEINKRITNETKAFKNRINFR